MAKKKGKHVKDPSEASSTQKDVKSVNVVIESAKDRRQVVAKRISIVAIVIIGILGAAYLAGVFFFSTHFMPNSTISDTDVSLATPDEISAEMSDKVESFEITVTGYGLDGVLSSDETGLNIDSQNLVDSMSASQNPWAWPVQVFESRDMTQALTDSLSATKLAEVVDKMVSDHNSNAPSPENA